MEINYDKMLRIKTSGRDDSHADQYRFPYEPTPYEVLERLANRGYITKKNTLVDYGCGKGRVGLFLSYQTRCHSIGIEFDERIYEAAKANQESGVSGKRCEFINISAENYELPKEVDRCFFFNPFSIEIFKSVIMRIRESYYEYERELMIFLYYPQSEYRQYLEEQSDIFEADDIDCSDFFDGMDERERILVYKFQR